MPFDEGFDRFVGVGARNRRFVALWLFALCFMILVMVVLGGATRLTGSGLSIMEWDPIMGVLPPWSEAEWQRLYGLYRQIPQYALINKGFGLEGFKQIFWLEWTHRLWGRLMGVVFIVPFAVLVWRRAIPRSLVPRLVGLFVLGGLQGAVGWFMVASGFFPESTAVSPYRLVVHLALALLLYAALLWTGLGLWGTAPVPRRRGLSACAGLTALLVTLTILAGGFVAGLHAGLTYNTFPLMDGRLVPEGYISLRPAWKNVFENVPAVQFDHRLLATLTSVAAGATILLGVSVRTLRPFLRALAAAVAVQYVLGVATLLAVVPPALAVAHQAVAVLVLTATLVLLHALVVSPLPSPMDAS